MTLHHKHLSRLSLSIRCNGLGFKADHIIRTQEKFKVSYLDFFSLIGPKIVVVGFAGAKSLSFDAFVESHYVCFQIIYYYAIQGFV